MIAKQKQTETDFFEQYALTFSYLILHSNTDVQRKKKDLEKLKNSSRAGCL